MADKENIIIQVNSDLKHRVKSKCSRNNQSMTEYLTQLIHKDLGMIDTADHDRINEFQQELNSKTLDAITHISELKRVLVDFSESQLKSTIQDEIEPMADVEDPAVQSKVKSMADRLHEMAQADARGEKVDLFGDRLFPNKNKGE